MRRECGASAARVHAAVGVPAALDWLSQADPASAALYGLCGPLLARRSGACLPYPA